MADTVNIARADTGALREAIAKHRILDS